MPSSLNLFIRVPKDVNENAIIDAIAIRDMCKVLKVYIKKGIYIKKGKLTKNAVVMVDYWYRGTSYIRDILIKGEPISVIVGPYMLLAYEFKPCQKIVHTTVHIKNEADEFGRDIPRQSKPTLRADAPAFVPMSQLKIAPALQTYDVFDNQHKNEYAANDFIKKYEYECYINSNKNDTQCAIAPSAGAVPTTNTIKSTDMEDGEICEIAEKKPKSIISNRRYSNKNANSVFDCGHDAAAKKRKVKFVIPTNK